MAWTQEELTAIETAYKSGVRRVQFKDRSTEFRDLAEMREIIADARAELQGVRRKSYYPVNRRGYQS